MRTNRYLCENQFVVNTKYSLIRFVYLRFIKRKDVLFKELLDLVKEGKIKKDDEMDIFTNEMANRSYGCIFLIIIVAIIVYFLR